MQIFLTTVHILTCFFLIAVVLLQHGKGADIGAAFGAGASNTVFGSRGAGNFLTKLTTGGVVVFMLTSITLSYFTATGGSITDELREATPPIEEPAPFQPEAPSGFETVPIPRGAPEGAAPEGFEVIPAPAAESPSEP